MGLHCNGRLLALPANIILGWKGWGVTNTNTLAYFDTAKITAVKSFMIQAPGKVKIGGERGSGGIKVPPPVPPPSPTGPVYVKKFVGW